MADLRPDENELDPAPLSGLAADLRRVADARIEIPPQVDDAVLGEASRVLSARRRPGRPLRSVAAWTAAAAGVTLVVWAGWWYRPARAPHHLQAPAPAVRSFPSGDVDRNGRVDILDAFALARGLESGAAPAGGDVNDDGRIDRADVDAIAMLAVRLPREGAG